jgi:hypothetical protein
MSNKFNILISYPLKPYQPDIECFDTAKLESLLIECIDDYLDHLAEEIASDEDYEADDE